MLNKIAREICVAGAVIDVTLKASFRSVGKRRPKTEKTRESVQKHNDRLATKKMTRLLNANFFPGDLHLILSYAEVVTPEVAARQLSNWIKRMRREYKKAGKEFYWVAVTEYKYKRIHHHVVVNYIDVDIVNRQWKNGIVRVAVMEKHRNYKKLAEYLVKETQQTFREPDCATKRRWSGSQNLKRPIIKKEWVSIRHLWEDPKALKGYAIDKDSVRRYENPVTKLEHLEYMMVSTDPVPRIKTWRKGDVVKRGESYARAEELQVNMEDLILWDII